MGVQLFVQGFYLTGTVLVIRLEFLPSLTITPSQDALLVEF